MSRRRVAAGGELAIAGPAGRTRLATLALVAALATARAATPSACRAVAAAPPLQAPPRRPARAADQRRRVVGSRPARGAGLERGRLAAIHSVGPLVEGVPLDVTAWSYAGRLNAGVLVCPARLSDPHVVARGMHEALAKRLAAAGARRALSRRPRAGAGSPRACRG